MAPFTNICIEKQQSSSTFALPENSKPEPFCSFCLRERPQNVEFYKHVIGASQEMRTSLQSMLGYDFNLANFAICKPCWKVIQLIQDFRLRCSKANEVVQRMPKGLSNADDGWFSTKNLAMIENVRMSVQDQMRHIEKINATKRALVLDDSTGEDSVEEKINDGLKLETPEVESSDAVSDDSTAEEAVEENINDLRLEAPEVESSDAVDEVSETQESSSGHEDTIETDEVHPQQHKCPQCPKTFKSKRGLKNHGPFCVQRLEIPPPDYFKNHLEKHGTIATFQCTQNCDKLFFSEPVRAHHERICAENARNLCCATCGKRFKTRYHLRTHEWCQHSENARIFPCEVCGKMFKQQSAVTQHKKSHSDLEQFECGSCPMKFWSKRTLTHHLRTMHAKKVAPKGASES